MNTTGDWCGRVLVSLLFVTVSTASAAAGFLEDVGGTLEKNGKSIADVAKKVGEGVRVGDTKGSEAAARASAKLPGGVSSRLKKIQAELDKAEKALKTGAGTDVDRAQRAEQYLKRAIGYKSEIAKQYAGQYSEDHPDVAAAFGRLAALENSVKASGQDAAAAEEARRRAKEAEEAAAARAASDREAARKMQEEEAATAAQEGEELCESWNQRLKVYTEGEKALYACSVADDATMPKCKGMYDEAVALMKEFNQSAVASDPCGAVRSTLSDINRYMDNFKGAYETYSQKDAEAKANKGEIVFSTSPIDPENPSELSQQFKVGDRIYGLIRTTKPWSAIYENEDSASVMVNVNLDGKKIHAQFVNLKKPELVQRQYLRFDIAPDPEKMTAYSNPDIEYGKSTATTRQGPNELTHHLGELGPGTHTMTFEIQSYGTVWAAGEFTIEGTDFEDYAKLHSKIAGAVSQAVALPEAKMVDKKMEAEMKALLENAGWKNIHRINIVDKDWWIDRTSGGDSPVKSRHMAAAALAKGDDGTYFYKVCTFHQDKLISGEFGKLYLSHQGDQVPVPRENIDK